MLIKFAICWRQPTTPASPNVTNAMCHADAACSCTIKYDVTFSTGEAICATQQAVASILDSCSHQVLLMANQSSD
jgi:hypothetical protein